ncbi:hypothetical protein DXF93_03935 [Escherichia coli]|nr:hypothetical protein C2U51_09770 [Enterobacteriaceae bacterium ENNIH1]RDT56297.1 hypothetical protein DXF93_03935 [Escherichia coli]
MQGIFLIVVGFYLFYGLAGAANLDVTVANSAVNAYNMVGTSNKVTMGNSIPACCLGRLFQPGSHTGQSR